MPISLCVCAIAIPTDDWTNNSDSWSASRRYVVLAVRKQQRQALKGGHVPQCRGRNQANTRRVDDTIVTSDPSAPVAARVVFERKVGSIYTPSGQGFRYPRSVMLDDVVAVIAR